MLLKYNNSQLLAKLNTLEKILLIIFLKNVKDNESALEIFNSIDC